MRWEGCCLLTQSLTRWRLTANSARAKFAPQIRSDPEQALGFAVFSYEEVRLMLRDARRRPAEEQPLTKVARLLLLEDHRRGLHSKPEDQCELCPAPRRG